MTVKTFRSIYIF